MFDVKMLSRSKIARLAPVIALFAIVLAAAQVALFYARYAPQVAQANSRLYDLTIESTQRKNYRKIAADIEALIAVVDARNEGDRTFSEAWREFENHFTVAPIAALDSLREDLIVLTAGIDSTATATRRLDGDLDRLQSMYRQDFKALLAQMKRPPWYLWPTGPLVATRSGFREAVTMNRAVYLAQTGEIGTARVMLAGLNASVDDTAIEAQIYYTLARLQFELFRRSPEADYYTQSVHYLRQSLRTDPEYALAKRLLDFLLSLDQAATAPQSTEGRPESPSEGEGAAVSAEKRIF